MVNKLIAVAVFAVLMIIAGLLWKEKTATEEENRVLQAELTELNDKLDTMAASIPEPTPAPDAVETAEPPAEPAAPPPPAPPAPALDVESAAAVTTEDGIVATLAFKPQNNTPLGDLFVAVRLPGGEGRIEAIDFSPQDALNSYQKRVSDSGDFAAVRAQARNMEHVELSITISGPAELDVRGTCGIGPMSLNVSADSAVTGPPK